MLTVAIFWRYLDGNYLAGSDGMGPLADLEMMRVDSSYFSAWREITALGHTNYPSPTLSTLYYVGMGVLGISPSLLWKAMIVIAFFMAGLLMYLCAKSITGSFMGSLLAGLVYSLNQVFLSQITEVHHFFILGYALFPLLFLLLYRTMDGTGKWSVVALPAVALAYGTIGAPHTILITGVFLVLFALFYAYFHRPRNLRGRLQILGAGVICTLLVVLPLVLIKFGGVGGSTLDVHYVIQEAEKASSYSLYHSLVLASSENTYIFGTGGGQWTYPAFLWPVGLAVAVLIPVFALFSLKLKSQRPLVLSLLIPALIFVVVAAGPNPPNRELFTLAFANVPLMDSIRAYSRFDLLTGFAFALLIAMVMAHMDEVRAGLPKVAVRYCSHL